MELGNVPIYLGFTSKAGWAKKETITTDKQSITTPRITADAFAKAAAPIRQTAMFTALIVDAYLDKNSFHIMKL